MVVIQPLSRRDTVESRLLNLTTIMVVNVWFIGLLGFDRHEGASSLNSNSKT
jgi:hypothetical protein